MMDKHLKNEKNTKYIEDKKNMLSVVWRLNIDCICPKYLNFDHSKFNNLKKYYLDGLRHFVSLLLNVIFKH